MQRKLITVILGLVAALASLGAGAASAQSSLSACPELRAACQPIVDRSVDPQPRSQLTRPKAVPQPFTDRQGQTFWRAGRHVMY